MALLDGHSRVFVPCALSTLHMPRKFEEVSPNVCAKRCVPVQGMRYDIHNVLNEAHVEFSNTVADMWEHAEVFDFKAERVFRYLQVGRGWYSAAAVRACGQSQVVLALFVSLLVRVGFAAVAAHTSA